MRPDQDATKVIYQGAFFSIGQFRRGPRHSNFTGPHQIGGTLLVFPRTSVMIAHAGKEPVVADPNTVMYYNDGQVYSRHKLSDQGDLCEWFGFDTALVSDAIRPFDAHVDDHPNEPFTASHGPSDATSYLLQRAVVTSILSDPQPDFLFMEETVMQILRQVIENDYKRRGLMPRHNKRAAEREVVQNIRKYLSLHFEQHISLEQISAHLHFSPFHLCRIFRKHTGIGIHQYLNQLRLRAALEYVTQPGIDLTSLAIKLGYASHSHFTEAFRKTFGVAPSRLRDTSSRSMRQRLSKISIA